MGSSVGEYRLSLEMSLQGIDSVSEVYEGPLMRESVLTLAEHVALVTSVKLDRVLEALGTWFTPSV